ncbi:hypothetical protein [Armatimonas sp.]|uniref:hypothetical protein n=1 Tax=Armatimonas sp. TaxID=1872638 RepID=UPI003752AC2A
MTAEEQGLIDRAMGQITLLGELQSSALFQLPECPVAARETLTESLEHANHARRALRLAGARIPVLDDKPREERLDLSELAALDSTAARELLAGLNQLQALAERYDGERGKMIGGQGADFGEGIAAMRSRLRQLLGIREGARE